MKHEIDTTPDTSLTEKIGAASFTVAEAVAELVANSMDARVELNPLHIEVAVGPTEVAVSDDGAGMTLDILREAVRLAVDMDEFHKRKDRKGMYGLGLKTACASLGRQWSILTRTKGAETDLSITFDFDEIASRPKSSRTEWKATIEEVKRTKSSRLGDREHGTLIRIAKLRDRNPMSGPVMDNLGRAYKPHLGNGDVIRVNEVPAAPPAYDLLEGSKQEFDKTFGDRPYRVHGWIGLDKKTHNDDAFGINLYRKGQLIVPWNKDWFRIHLMTSKIVGEVNIDFVPVNFHKKGFDTQSDEWKAVTAFMREFMKPFVRASEQSIKGRHDKTKEARAVKGLNAAMGAAPGLNFGGDTAGSGSTDEKEEKKSRDDVAVEPTIEIATLHLADGPISLSFSFVAGGDEQTLWGHLYDSGSRDLVAVINTQSQAFKESKDQEMLAIFGLADSVMEFLMREHSFDLSKALDLRNQWVRAALQDRAAVKRG